MASRKGLQNARIINGLVRLTHPGERIGPKGEFPAPSNQSDPPDPPNETAAQAGPLSGGKTGYRSSSIGILYSTERSTEEDASWSSSRGSRPKRAVRRDSHERGRCERLFWKPTSRRDMRQIVVAAKRYELDQRKRGKRSGPLGSVAIKIVELFANLVDFRTGRLDPSIDTIVRRLKRSRDAVVRALKNLRLHGFLNWLRRYEPVPGEGRGPQVKQTSNAYRLSLPERARALSGHRADNPPVPEDQEHVASERAALMEAYRASLDIVQRALLNVGDNPLGQALARLGGFIRERESAKRPRSLSHMNHMAGD